MLPRWLSESRAQAGPAAIAALGALTVATFCVVTTENLPAGLLPQISNSLGVSLFASGQLVTGYALTVTILTVPLTYATRRIGRRRLLIGLMTLFVVASAGSALAPNYGLLLASRIVTALVHAVFWAVVTVAATGLFPPAVRGRVIAVVYGATSIATIVGVPAGTWLGQQAGWRAAFAGLSGIGLLALISIAVFLPSTAERDTQGAEAADPDIRRYLVLLATTVLAMTGLAVSFTYTVPFLTDVSGFSVRAISPLLVLRGAAGVASLALAGSLADRSPRLATNAPVMLLSAAFLGLYLAGTMPLFASVFVALSGVALFTMITTLTSELLSVAPGNLYIASAWGNAVFNAGTAIGSLVGGLVLPAFGIRSTALAAGMFAAGAVSVLLVDQVVGRRPHGVMAGADPAPGERLSATSRP